MQCAIQQLSTQMLNSTTESNRAAKQLLRYPKGTQHSACARELLGLAELFKEHHYNVSVRLEVDSDSAKHSAAQGTSWTQTHRDMMLVNTVTSIRESSVHEEQHSRSFLTKHLDGLRTRAPSNKSDCGTNVGIADGRRRLMMTIDRFFYQRLQLSRV